MQWPAAWWLHSCGDGVGRMSEAGRSEQANALKFHLGCGKRKLPGFFGIDIALLPGVDLVCDLRLFPWPFQDDSADEVALLHVLEPSLVLWLR
jgi:hypothetical protein